MNVFEIDYRFIMTRLKNVCYRLVKNCDKKKYDELTTDDIEHDLSLLPERERATFSEMINPYIYRHELTCLYVTFVSTIQWLKTLFFDTFFGTLQQYFEIPKSVIKIVRVDGSPRRSRNHRGYLHPTCFQTTKKTRDDLILEYLRMLCEEETVIFMSTNTSDGEVSFAGGPCHNTVINKNSNGKTKRHEFSSPPLVLGTLQSPNLNGPVSSDNTNNNNNNNNSNKNNNNNNSNNNNNNDIDINDSNSNTNGSNNNIISNRIENSSTATTGATSSQLQSQSFSEFFNYSPASASEQASTNSCAHNDTNASSKGRFQNEECQTYHSFAVCSSRFGIYYVGDFKCDNRKGINGEWLVGLQMLFDDIKQDTKGFDKDGPNGLLLNKYREQFLDILSVWRNCGEYVIPLPSEPSSSRRGVSKNSITYRKLNMGANNWVSGFFAYLFGLLDMCRQHGLEFINELKRDIAMISDRYLHQQMPLQILHFLLTSFIRDTK
ncbi:hypothetical protein RFI_30867 [Reticulomyxa filosa]|uniref:Uncharacterized protein n=1 Tax=Reticulomyxa filosa TaxID=46433 RepID=X6LY36_RETFI|nr:hypothetical protein RFI_30867 [Reticulomyxa filosa]|eukprot:ETO06524.1 hypothetical protein RFI_30867 [Reticulomyxa filosa]